MSEGLRQESSDRLRVTLISPGYVDTNFTEHVTSLGVQAELAEVRRTAASSKDAAAEAVACAIAKPPDVDIGEIVLRTSAVR